MAWLSLIKKSSWETLLNSEIVSEQILTIKRNNSNQLSEKVNRIESKLLLDVKRTVMQIKEKVHTAGSVIPIQEHGFALAKFEFRDALRIRYNKQLQGMRSKCPCCQKYNLNHDVNCKRGGFVVMRHNNAIGFEANPLNTIQNDVEIEPALQKNRMKE